MATTTTAPLTHEAAVRNFYDDDGEGAGAAYTALMDVVWHHGTLDAEHAGATPAEAARAMQKRLCELAGIRQGQRVLDFGSGVGGATIAMAKATGATFTGICNSDSLNHRARTLAARAGAEDLVSFLGVGDLDYQRLLPWADNSIDAVIFLESVCHLPDKQALFAAVHRVLKPGGRLAGLDWLQRPYGAYQTDEQIAAIMDPVREPIRLSPLGTLDSYRQMMTAAGLTVTHAVDEYAGEECWGSTPEADRSKWLTYDGPHGDLFQQGKRALDRARTAGVFTVGWWIAVK